MVSSEFITDDCPSLALAIRHHVTELHRNLATGVCRHIARYKAPAFCGRFI